MSGWAVATAYGPCAALTRDNCMQVAEHRWYPLEQLRDTAFSLRTMTAAQHATVIRAYMDSCDPAGVFDKCITAAVKNLETKLSPHRARAIEIALQMLSDAGAVRQEQQRQQDACEQQQSRIVETGSRSSDTPHRSTLLPVPLALKDLPELVQFGEP